MDELKETAEQNRHDLEALTGAIARAESNKADLNAQLEALKRLSSIDTEVVREALRIPTEVDKVERANLGIRCRRGNRRARRHGGMGACHQATCRRVAFGERLMHGGFPGSRNPD